MGKGSYVSFWDFLGFRVLYRRSAGAGVALPQQNRTTRKRQKVMNRRNVPRNAQSELLSLLPKVSKGNVVDRMRNISPIGANPGSKTTDKKVVQNMCRLCTFFVQDLCIFLSDRN